MTGQLEQRLLNVWIQASQLKRYLSRPDAPPAIKECKALFDKANLVDEPFEPSVDSENGERNQVPVPAELRSIIPDRNVVLHARYKSQGVVYTRFSTHLGNSLIYYHSKGDRTSDAVPGSIQHILERGKRIIFSVQRHLPKHPHIFDPFSPYPNFPAKLYSCQMSASLEIVELDWVVSHFARWQIFSDHVAIVSLSKVCISCSFLCHIPSR